MRADQQVRQWELDNKQSYDTASVGSSALLAALSRNLAAEVAHWLGLEFASIFNDYEKYFDSMDLETLFVEAVMIGFPLAPLVFAMQQHMAPRILTVNGCSSKPININASIIAGCKISVPATRLYPLRHLKPLVELHPEANTSVFVDDTSMSCAGNTYEEILNVLVPAMRSFKKITRRLKLKLSLKAVIDTSSPKLTKFLTK